MSGYAKIAPPMTVEFSDVERRRIRSAVGDFDMPTSEYWRGVMIRARKARLTQGELGDAVGCSQNTISDLESGKQAASKFVPAICVALGIPLPMFFAKDEYDERWLEAGRFLRSRNMRRFLQYLAIFEEEAGIEPASEDQADPVESADGGAAQRVRRAEDHS